MLLGECVKCTLKTNLILIYLYTYTLLIQILDYLNKDVKTIIDKYVHKNRLTDVFEELHDRIRTCCNDNEWKIRTTEALIRSLMYTRWRPILKPYRYTSSLVTCIHCNRRCKSDDDKFIQSLSTSTSTSTDIRTIISLGIDIFMLIVLLYKLIY